MSPEARVLVTGASGHIGQSICPFLAEQGFWLRGFDLRPCAHVHEHVQCDLQDLRTLRKAVREVDTVVHLAACSDEADFITRLVPANVIGLYNVFEAVRLEGVMRMIAASSCQVADLMGQQQPITAADRFPTDHYGLTKLWAEDMGRMYSHKYGISTLMIRLGWVVRDRRELRELTAHPVYRHFFLGHRDLRAFISSSLSRWRGTFDVLYAVSDPGASESFDIGPAQLAIGFQPRDSFPSGIDWFDEADVGSTS